MTKQAVKPLKFKETYSELPLLESQVKCQNYYQIAQMLHLSTLPMHQGQADLGVCAEVTDLLNSVHLDASH